MGNKVTKYITDGDKTIVKIYNKVYRLSATGTVKVHADDVDFANSRTGQILAKAKADAKYYDKLSTAKTREANALRAIAQELDKEAVADFEKSLQAKINYKTRVEAKTKLYERLKAHREAGGYQSTSFESIGDLTKGLTDEQRLEIAKQMIGDKD